MCDRTRTRRCRRHVHSLSRNMLEHEGATVLKVEAADAMFTPLATTCSNTKVRPYSNSKLPAPCPLTELQHARTRRCDRAQTRSCRRHVHSLSCDMLEHEGATALELEAAAAMPTHLAATYSNTKVRPSCSNSKLPPPCPLTLLQPWPLTYQNLHNNKSEYRLSTLSNVRKIGWTRARNYEFLSH